MSRLKSIFPDGVCDWSRPGVNQRKLKDTWLGYPTPGNAVGLAEDSDRDDHRYRGRRDHDD